MQSVHNLCVTIVTLLRPSSKPIPQTLCGNASRSLTHLTQTNPEALTQIKSTVVPPTTFGTNRTSQAAGFRLSDGTVVKWLQQVSDFFMVEAGVQKSTPAADYFDPAPYLATIQ